MTSSPESGVPAVPVGSAPVGVNHVASNPVGLTSSMSVSSFSRVLRRVEVGDILNLQDMFGSWQKRTACTVRSVRCYDN